jgi:hypothetical protein
LWSANWQPLFASIWDPNRRISVGARSGFKDCGWELPSPVSEGWSLYGQQSAVWGCALSCNKRTLCDSHLLCFVGVAYCTASWNTVTVTVAQRLHCTHTKCSQIGRWESWNTITRSFWCEVHDLKLLEMGRVMYFCCMLCHSLSGSDNEPRSYPLITGFKKFSPSLW